jgi:nucleotide-binding universal stress UspA family protein
MSEIFSRILIADDCSDDGEQAASIGLALAAQVKAQVILLGIIEPPNIQGEGEGLPVEDPSIARHRLTARFEQLIQLGGAQHVEIVMEIGEGSAADQIRRRALVDRADLIIVGRRHLSRMKRWLEGSTSESLVRDGPCSILVVK